MAEDGGAGIVGPTDRPAEHRPRDDVRVPLGQAGPPFCLRSCLDLDV